MTSQVSSEVSRQQSVRLNAMANLQGSQLSCILYVCEMTGYGRQEQAIPESSFISFLPCSRRSIQEALTKLQETGWLNAKRTGSQVKTYGLGSKAQKLPVAEEKKERSKERKEDQDQESTHTQRLVVTTGKSKKVATLRGRGTSQQLLLELQKVYSNHDRLEFILERLRYWKVKSLRDCFCQPLDVMWSIIKNFECDAQKKHRMRDPGAILRYRLMNGIDKWLPEDAMQKEVPSGLVEKWQAIVDKQFTVNNASPQVMYQIVRDMRNEAEVPFLVAQSYLDTHGMEVAL